jgi:hypothetical protein
MTHVELADRLAEICMRLSRIERELSRIATPIALMRASQVAERLGGRSVSSVNKLLRCHFTDARPPNERRPGCKRLAYSDEVRGLHPGGASRAAAVPGGAGPCLTPAAPGRYVPRGAAGRGPADRQDAGPHPDLSPAPSGAGMS